MKLQYVCENIKLKIKNSWNTSLSLTLYQINPGKIVLQDSRFSNNYLLLFYSANNMIHCP